MAHEREVCISLLSSGMYEHAQFAARDLVKARPRDADSYMLQATVFQAMGNYSKAAAAYEVGLRAVPGDQQLIEGQASLAGAKADDAFHSKDYEIALQHYDESLAGTFGPSSTLRSALLNNRARNHVAMKNYHQALVDFDECVTRAESLEDSDLPVYYANRSDCRSERKEYQEALEDANKSIKLDAKFADAYASQTRALIGLGRIGEAAAAHKAGIKLDPQSIDLKEVAKELQRAQAGR